MTSGTKKQGADAAEGWKKISLDDKHKLYKIHQYLFLSAGKTYNIEVQETQHGDFVAHADNTTDPHDAIKSVAGSSADECLAGMVKQLAARG